MANNNFPACLAFTLKYEGGMSFDPRDPGGRTNQGVTETTYAQYRKSKGLAWGSVYAMTAAERDAIYRDEYWAKVTGDSLPRGVDLCVFDYGVNSGPPRALRAYAARGHGKKPGDAIHALCSSRLSFLHALRTWGYFGAGWGRRVAACEVSALKMAGASLEDAQAKMHAKQSAGSYAAFASAGAAFVAIFQSLHLHWLATAIIIFFGAFVILSYIGKSRQAGVRADTLSAAIEDMKVKHDALEQMAKIVGARIAANAIDMARKQQGIALAQAAIADLGLKPTEKK